MYLLQYSSKSLSFIITHLRFSQQSNYIIFFTIFIIIVVIIQWGLTLIGKFCNWIISEIPMLRFQFNDRIRELHHKFVTIFLTRCWSLSFYWSRPYYTMATSIISTYPISVYIFISDQVYRVPIPKSIS